MPPLPQQPSLHLQAVLAQLLVALGRATQVADGQRHGAPQVLAKAVAHRLAAKGESVREVVSAPMHLESTAAVPVAKKAWVQGWKCDTAVWLRAQPSSPLPPAHLMPPTAWMYVRAVSGFRPLPSSRVNTVAQERRGE